MGKGYSELAIKGTVPTDLRAFVPAQMGHDVNQTVTCFLCIKMTKVKASVSDSVEVYVKAGTEKRSRWVVST